MICSTSDGSAAARSSGVGYRANRPGGTRFTRTSVVCAERIVAVSNWNALSWSSSQRASGYSSVRRRLTSRARPFGDRGRAIAEQHRGVTEERWVVSSPTEEDDARADDAGLRSRRDLFQLRRPLPVEDALRAGLPTITTRAFRPGVDEDAWLVVNNRSFASHPDQSNQTRADLAAQQREPWFDPAGGRPRGAAAGAVVRPRRLPRARRRSGRTPRRAPRWLLLDQGPPGHRA